MPTEFQTINLPGHFCAAFACGFGRTTMVPGYFVSSVGEFANGEVARGRKYETMVFPWSGERRSDGTPVPTDWAESDMLPANTRAECIANHEALVAKFGTPPC